MITFSLLFSLQVVGTPVTHSYTPYSYYSYRTHHLIHSETQTEESSFCESLEYTLSTATCNSNPIRQLHLNLPTSPNQGEDTKVTDMSLSSEASSSKTPGFDTYIRQKSFTTPTVEDEDQISEEDTSHEYIDDAEHFPLP
jgi:hypothetical protein